jgi:hypothetical protein
LYILVKKPIVEIATRLGSEALWSKLHVAAPKISLAAIYAPDAAAQGEDA